MRDNRHQGVEGVVDALKAQHQQIRTAMFAVLGAEGEARQRAFLAVRQLLALHEVVEEEVVHPVAGASLISGQAIVADRLKEEDQVLVMISELEQFEVDAHEFAPRFRALQLAVTAHAEAEEEAELGALPHRVVGREAAAELTSRFGMAQQVDAAGLTGSFAAMMGEVRDELGALDRAR